MYESQRTILGVIPQALPSLPFETGSLAGNSVWELDKMPDQQAPGICVSLPSRDWDYKHMPPALAFYRDSGDRTPVLKLEWQALY